ncbi:hypothetical protein [Streptomyces sp. V4I2]|uniref:hypothetical protein n=1 Tax=Streptomyces sp. V4I2 TaxID=3042280 RepID=UPI0027813538|nr:hypothetical protein [Streptomyces sp. V4I2]MDQ1046819.1 hypothetical protein [Streptomyces sp. V4I2]
MSTSAPLGTHFWVMSVEKPGLASVTRTGTYTPQPDSTREAAFADIYQFVGESAPQLRGATVLFFSLERNTL